MAAKEKVMHWFVAICKMLQARRLLMTFFSFFLFGLHPWHMEVPRLGVESELQLPASAMPDP